jgi:pyruvate/2-oxoglutarate/acetoin dehydrogenase E1 component/TPP-dependent pyruvate/acetoin dehydrogenase alpha subunit
MTEQTQHTASIIPNIPQNFSVPTVLNDYWICCVSREASLQGRREILSGHGKFGIFGDGKEVPQVALAHAFCKGDWRSGYYRDQTMMLALGIANAENLFAQIYGDTQNDPFCGGRNMNNHYATRMFDTEGEWVSQKNQYNVTSDIASTAAQMGRGLGLAYASNKYRALGEALPSEKFSDNGNEICICTIGDASTSEGAFWETINAAGVLQTPLGVCVWDDGFGISVPTQFQTTKGSISEVLKGFQTDEHLKGIDIYTAHAWDYPALVQMFEKGIEKIRRDHTPALFHVTEVTQPQGHSTSGSHERYKTKARLAWEKEYDCLVKMREWLLQNDIAAIDTLIDIEERARQHVRESKNRAWAAYNQPTKIALNSIKNIYTELENSLPDFAARIQQTKNELYLPHNFVLTDLLKNARQMQFLLASANKNALIPLKKWINDTYKEGHERYHTHLFCETSRSALKIPVVAPTYSEASAMKNGYEIINAFFDASFAKHPTLFAFGEDVGQIGDVNQGFAGLQTKYTTERIFDTGIREWTIIGQAIGMAMRGLKPIAEIQYLDYLIYALSPLSDDVACLRYRSKGLQAAPIIVRTRGHRLEGIWHSGSPMQMMLGSLQGMYLCVPRNYVQAAGMYQTLIASDDPAIVVECLNGYRLKELLPDNMGDYTVPLGIPEILKEGNDVTLVTYGSCTRIAQAAVEQLLKIDISVELIDIQTLIPFDIHYSIQKSLQKTNRLVILDEDIPGGASAYILQKIMEEQNGYQYLDSKPITLTAKAHRPPYTSDGDYFTKPNVEDVFEAIYTLLQEAMPEKWVAL